MRIARRADGRFATLASPGNGCVEIARSYDDRRSTCDGWQACQAEILAWPRSVFGAQSELDADVVLRLVLEVACKSTWAHYAALGVLDERGEALEQFFALRIDDAGFDGFALSSTQEASKRGERPHRFIFA
jgi:hypothetical protein